MNSDAIAEAYRRGRLVGEALRGNLFERAANYMDWARLEYPASAELDYLAECYRLDGERLDAVPDLTRYPELRGYRDLLVAERQGFRDAGHPPEWVAWHYTWPWFISHRLGTRYVGRAVRPAGCTAVFFAHSDEGPLLGRNRDVPLSNGSGAGCEEVGPDGKRGLRFAQVSAAVLCDEEPEEIFPVEVLERIPPDCRRLKDVLAFLERYNEFWGPGNLIVMDEWLESAAVEKSNCRMGVRPAIKGASAVTACSYLTTGMRQFKLERDRLSLERRNWTEDSPDWVFWRGCDRRYERLLRLVAEATQGGPTVGGLIDIMLDHAVPFPDRICLAGETGHPEQREGNWTMDTTVEALEGPTRRVIAWRVQDATPAYRTKPVVAPGPGIEMRLEWLEEAESHSGG